MHLKSHGSNRMTNAALYKNASRNTGTPPPSSKTRRQKRLQYGSFEHGLSAKSILTLRTHRLTRKTKRFCQRRERALVARNERAATHFSFPKFGRSPFARTASATEPRSKHSCRFK